MASTVQLTSKSHVLTEHFMFGIAVLVSGGWWSIPRTNPSKNIDKWLQEAANNTWSHVFMIPADIVSLLSTLERSPANLRIESIISGSAPVLPALIRRWTSKYPYSSFYAVYGMTEALPIAITPGHEKFSFNDCDYAGTVNPNLVATIENPDENGHGEIILEGASVMKGYLDQSPTQKHHTGDIGKIVSGDRIALVGRKKDMLIRGNRNIYPGLYEPHIRNIEGIEDAVIVGVPDEYGDDLVVLFLVGTAESVKRAKNELANIMDYDSNPDEIITIDAIPLRGKNRKPDRLLLKEIAAANPYIIKHLNNRKEKS